MVIIATRGIDKSFQREAIVRVIEGYRSNPRTFY
jgi:hypothetical protein